MSGARVLFVDDEPNILTSVTRHLRKTFTVTTATSGKEGLERIESDEEFAVIVSDMRMPEMDGVQFLTAVKRRSPFSIRLMLTGMGDVQTAISAVNQGNIFRFLTKPCPPNELRQALLAALVQHRLVRSERDLLEKTLKGCVQVLTEVLSIVNPTAFGRAARVQELVAKMSEHFEGQESWQLEIAAMLSQIGCVVLPQETMKKMFEGQPLDEVEQGQVDKYPKVSHDLVARIPRMDEVARSLLYQQVRYDGGGTSMTELRGDGLPFGSRVLKVVLDFDDLQSEGKTGAEALKALELRDGWYDGDIVDALKAVVNEQLDSNTAVVNASQLRVGMILKENLLAGNGALLAAHGTQVTTSLLQRVQHWIPTTGVREPVAVFTTADSSP